MNMVIIGYICRDSGKVCEYATVNGYCQVTACIKRGYSTTTTCAWSEKVPKPKEG